MQRTEIVSAASEARVGNPEKVVPLGRHGWVHFPRDFVDRVVAQTNIVDVIQRRVDLKKKGINYLGLCPFHNESSPSFTVHEDKGFYHCFGCGANGDAIKFLQESEGLAFADAVKTLAQSAGLDIPQSQDAGPPPKRVNPVLYEMLAKAAQFYQESLRHSPMAMDYLIRRGVSAASAHRFGIGFAPDGWQNLSEVFANYAAPELQACGLVIKRDDSRYDRFRDRLIVPIANADWQIIGFGGRVIGEGEPKYLNSPESEVFDKGRELFGLPQAYKAIRESSTVIATEGYMDVIALSQAGIRNAVATMGTALTVFHASKLTRTADRVIFCFDGDQAGRKAAWKGMENILPCLTDQKRVGFVFLPPEHDPDSFVKEFGAQEFTDLCEKATPLSQYVMQTLIQKHQPETLEGKAQLAAEVKGLLQKLNHHGGGLLRKLMFKNVSEVTGFSVAELEDIAGGAKC